MMRLYTQTTPDQKLELRIYPTEPESEVGVSVRLTKLEAKNLKDLIDTYLKEQGQRRDG
jgi:hypothetical protein